MGGGGGQGTGSIKVNQILCLPDSQCKWYDVHYQDSVSRRDSGRSEPSIGQCTKHSSASYQKCTKNKKDKKIVKYLYQINEVLQVPQFHTNLSFIATVYQWKIEFYLITINPFFNRFTSVTTHLGFWKTLKNYKFCSLNIPSGQLCQ